MNKLLEEIQASSLGEIVKDERGYKQVYKFLPGFLGFQGHFDGHPVLPAVVQMMVCREMALKQIAPEFNLARVSRAKFTSVVEANNVIEVYCELKTVSPTEYRCNCILEVSGEAASKFILTFMSEENQ